MKYLLTSTTDTPTPLKSLNLNFLESSSKREYLQYKNRYIIDTMLTYEYPEDFLFFLNSISKQSTLPESTKESIQKELFSIQIKEII